MSITPISHSGTGFGVETLGGVAVVKWKGVVAYTLIVVMITGGCASIPGNQVADQVRPMTVDGEIEEEKLLNVSIQVFDPGVIPEDAEESQGLSQGIRDAEARFIPVHLKYSLQRTGYWGAVRVVPGDENGAEVLVKGKIEYSDGESVAISVDVVDATGRLWFKKVYAETAKKHEHERIEPEKHDTFQDLFNTIANDLAMYRQQLSPQDVSTIRQVATLRFAAAMAPETFAEYLAEDDSGQFTIMHLPAADDAMFARIQALRSRDDMLVDVINGYYDNYYLDLWAPYSQWRRYRSEEVAAMRELERDALTRQVLGIAAIVGAIAIGAAADQETRSRTGTLRDVMVLGGAGAVYSGYQKRQESEINRDAIQELGESFHAEAEPLTIEVQGETLRLQGSAEEQYTRWRQLLREIYLKETGFPPPEVGGQAEEKGQ
ncbi:hypothetical protein [Desulfogranum marinum]|uniref:hypothetical protein n=1 Tax=Desulfogranum marinum TaxID=453220 RepID=UPI001963B805|nr:hypothetical protein [Desulfogranum marinum]MBM9514509.1 hypothetical protein [Desulfogranum marinum]